jgi:hypothetical protein
LASFAIDKLQDRFARNDSRIGAGCQIEEDSGGDDREKEDDGEGWGDVVPHALKNENAIEYDYNQ